ncbi:MAG: anaerobic ribonucleoside-triphosphate reductase activating protein [Ruminococcaceae bacterium]|nr:anaerobic ribonucleoside-triphosphate reductase activating protein [Oscillospiraceae bacterium]
MKIQGFQKLTLLDYPGKTAATVFTGGCNFRCPFCHNSDLVLNPAAFPEIPEEEVLSQLKKRSGFIDGVCITGGEPLLTDISGFIKKIKELGLLVKVDTNGSFPIRLRTLLLTGCVDYVAMDIKNSPEKYAETVGIAGFDTKSIESSVEILKDSGVDHEFRTTVVKELHGEKEMESIGRWLEGETKYFLQGYKLSDGVIDKSLTPHSAEDMKKLLETVRKYIPRAELRGIE